MTSAHFYLLTLRTSAGLSLLRLHPPLFARMCNFVQIFCANWAHTVDSAPILFYNKSRHESGLCHAPLPPYLLRRSGFCGRNHSGCGGAGRRFAVHRIQNLPKQSLHQRGHQAARPSGRQAARLCHGRRPGAVPRAAHHRRHPAAERQRGLRKPLLSGDDPRHQPVLQRASIRQHHRHRARTTTKFSRRSGCSSPPARRMRLFCSIPVRAIPSSTIWCRRG